MYKTIVNPETGRKVKVNGKIGQKVLNNYKKQYGGVPLTQDQVNALEKSRKAAQDADVDALRLGLSGIVKNRLIREAAAKKIEKSKGKIDYFFANSLKDLEGSPGLNVLKEAMKGNNDVINHIADNYRQGIYTRADHGLGFFNHVQKNIPLLNNTHESVILKIIKYLRVEKRKSELNSMGADCPNSYKGHDDKLIDTPDRPELCCNSNTRKVINIPYLSQKYGHESTLERVPLKKEGSVWCKTTDELQNEIGEAKQGVKLKHRLNSLGRKFQGNDVLIAGKENRRLKKLEEAMNVLKEPGHSNNNSI